MAAWQTNQPPGRGGGTHTLNAARLWAGGAANAAVAALIAIVGITVARGIFDVAVLAPKSSGSWGNANTVLYAIAAFGFGLLATALVHVLVSFTPSPYRSFGWILGLCTLAGALIPFATTAKLASQVATAVINAAIGIAVWTLTVDTARRATRLGLRGGGISPADPYLT